MNAIEIIDTHAHIQAAEFDADRDEVIARARAAGVSAIIVIGAGTGDGFSAAERAIDLAERYPFIWASAGIHPHDAETPLDTARLEELARHPRVVAVGETGFDFFRSFAPRDAQERWFTAQVEIAKRVGKPIIIHSREAGRECIELLKRTGADAVGGVFHCYAEDAAFARELAAINFKVSFPGTVTFKKADALRAVAAEIPVEQLFVETDAPYMAPEPNRGKRCESAFVVDTAKRIAAVKGMPFEEFARITTAEARRFFKL